MHLNQLVIIVLVGVGTGLSVLGLARCAARRGAPADVDTILVGAALIVTGVAERVSGSWRGVLLLVAVASLLTAVMRRRRRQPE